jgi:hypothetical protein
LKSQQIYNHNYCSVIETYLPADLKQLLKPSSEKLPLLGKMKPLVFAAAAVLLVSLVTAQPHGKHFRPEREHIG